MLKVGSIEEKYGEYSINRKYYRQDMIFKDEDACRNRKDEPCYAPELSYSVYTGNDILNIFNGQQEFADELFEGLDWQHPETLMEDWIRNNDWVVCDGCGELVDYGNSSNYKVCQSYGINIEA